LRVPTFIRKFNRGQTGIEIRSEEERSWPLFNFLGRTVGLCAGVKIVWDSASYIHEQTSQGNYVPLATLGITNALSLAFEWGYKRR
jgi:hypothetical protein